MGVVVGMLGVLLGIGLFLLGFFLGSKLTRPVEKQQAELTPEEVRAIREERLRLIAEQDAFKDLMSYNVTTAYELSAEEELKRAGDGS